ncbi:MAG TPA: hypothetical protein PLZ79_06480 [Burkholderiales bacterium]|nr:hypothetical protein [Burkholderiales bacterium]
MRLQDLDGDQTEPLPTDGLQVEEARDPDTVRLFVREWRRRIDRDLIEYPVARAPTPRWSGIIGA